jgi:hypothetical protein
MGKHTPGTVCSARLGDDWIDLGTTCRNQSSPPGVVGLSVLLGAAVFRNNPLQAKFDKDHVYSKAAEAARKRDIDLQIIGDDYGRSAEISLSSGTYLKELIRLGSNGKQTVNTAAKKIQFFIIRGGGEGFLPPDMVAKDASKVVFPGASTGGRKPTEFQFDDNDLLVVFGPKGKLIGAALLQRPISITGMWSEKTANAVYDKWNNKDVSIYRNTNFDVAYLGLVIDDGMKKRAWVDLHKQEATNGCIFIVDPTTPEYDPADAVKFEALQKFEPKLIGDILAAIGKTPDQVKGSIRLGVMHVVDIK